MTSMWRCDVCGQETDDREKVSPFEVVHGADVTKGHICINCFDDVFGEDDDAT